MNEGAAHGPICLIAFGPSIIKVAHPWYQGRSQDFSKGGAEVMEAKALKKEKLLVVRKSRKARNLWINN